MMDELINSHKIIFLSPHVIIFALSERKSKSLTSPCPVGIVLCRVREGKLIIWTRSEFPAIPIKFWSLEKVALYIFLLFPKVYVSINSGYLVWAFQTLILPYWWPVIKNFPSGEKLTQLISWLVTRKVFR